MMKHAILITLLGATMVLSACTSDKVEVLKSPCVGIEGSPCGPKRPVNGVLNPQLKNQPAPSEAV